MKKYTRKIIFGILIVSWMIIIFLFSNQNGDLSASKSQKIVNMIIKIFVKDFDSYSSIRQKELLSKLSFLIRKCAHMTEYAILALLVFFFLTDSLKLFRYIIPIIINDAPMYIRTRSEITFSAFSFPLYIFTAIRKIMANIHHSANMHLRIFFFFTSIFLLSFMINNALFYCQIIRS